MAGKDGKDEDGEEEGKAEKDAEAAAVDSEAGRLEKRPRGGLGIRSSISSILKMNLNHSDGFFLTGFVLFWILHPFHWSLQILNLSH